MTGAPGANAIGSWAATTGLAEAARRTVRALVHAGVEVALDDVEFGAPTHPSRLTADLADLPRGRTHDVDLCFMNLNEIMQLDEAALRGPPGAKTRRLVGFWYWELPFVPPGIAPQLARVDEIWVASRFVAETLRAAADVDVSVVPVTVAPMPDPGLGRRDFSLPESACIFLFSFDAHSTFARKNPWDLVRAVREAFSDEELSTSARLVVKAINLSSLPAAETALRAELASVNGILIDDDLSASEMGSLLACADVYVSLHRAEGFGLGMAESMYLGVPVVATGYSGNMDYMSVTNSVPIGYHLRGVEPVELAFNPGAEDVYVPGNLWAEPNLAHASRAIRRLYDRPDQRARLGVAGSRTIKARYSPAAVGAALRAQLEALATTPGRRFHTDV